jgi:hypothetical protein
MGRLHKDVLTFITSCWIIPKMRNIPDTFCTANQTNFMLKIFFKKSCHLWDNLKKCGAARQATEGHIIQRMCVACWITKASIHTHTQNMYYKLLFHGNRVITNTPQSYILRTLPLSLYIYSQQWLLPCPAPTHEKSSIVDQKLTDSE